MTSKTDFRLRTFLLVALWAAGLWAGRKGGGGDFEVLWQSVRAAWTGNPAGVYLKESSGPFFYPPIALLVFAPFALISTWSAAIVANLIFHSAAYWGFWWAFHALFDGLKNVSFWIWLLPFAVAIAPMHLDFMGQNIELPMAAGLILLELGTRGSSRNRFWVGFGSGVLSLIKLFPLFVSVTYLFRRDRKLSLGLIAGWIFGLVAPLLAFGSETGQYFYRQFFETLAVYHDKNLLTLNPGVLNFPALIATWSEPWVSTALRDELLLLLPGMLAASFFVWLLFRELSRGGEIGVWALSVTLMAFLNSSSRPDYFVFFVPSFGFLCAYWSSLVKSERACLILAFLLIAGTQQAVVSKPVNIQIEFWRLPVVGMALLAWANYSFLRRFSGMTRLPDSARIGT